MEKFGPRILGIALILMGVEIWFNPVHHSSKYQISFDFSEARFLVSTAMIILGILWLWTTFRKR